jgi:hypothetical protein
MTLKNFQMTNDWRGHRVVVNSPEAALAAIGVIAIVGSIG